MIEQYKNGRSLDELLVGIDQHDRIVLGRAISVVESKLLADKQVSSQLLDEIGPKTGNSIRIGVTGVPGVGKSTFIDAFGTLLTSKGHRVAVLTVDPSSSISKGSILGDKTRMNRLAINPNAFIRPSPSGTSLGGVAQRTREIISLCEAAGYDVIIIETVGVGQSETAVRDLVDFFLLLILAGGGDELQGIKRGIMEMADAIAINKADGENLKAAEKAKKAYENALHLFPQPESGWKVPTGVCSSLKEEGLESIWESILDYKSSTQQTGFFDAQRERQKLKWLHQLIKERLEDRFFSDSSSKKKLSALEKKVIRGELSVRHAIDKLFST